MPSPFPGMDPYLEQAAFWSSFHSRFIVAIADAIEPQLGPQYYVEVETRTYQSDVDEPGVLVGIPDAVVFSRSDKAEPLPTEPSDVETITATQARPERVTVPMPEMVNERYLEVRELTTDAVVTVIELLSPKNKRAGAGRDAYEKKRRTILGSATHLVELDLLRGGTPMTLLGVQTPTPYRILISRSEQRPGADLYGVTLQQPLPTVPIPLKLQEAEPWVDLQCLLTGVYARGRYEPRIDYRRSVPPPVLSPSDQAWVERVLSTHRSGDSPTEPEHG